MAAIGSCERQAAFIKFGRRGDEIRFHVEMCEQENLRAGLSHRQARQDALKRFGNVQTVREDCLDWPATELADSSLSGPDADPDGDGFANAVEYAINSSPRVANDRTLVQPELIDGTGISICCFCTRRDWAPYVHERSFL